MNEGIVTTGITPLTINSTETFELAEILDGLPWNLAGGTVTLKMTDPSGGTHTYTATIPASGYGAFVNWTVIAPVGGWLRAWDATDASGNRQVSLPIAFDVISSPT